MRTSFHHQPEAQHPNFQLSTSWQADYPIFGSLCGLKVGHFPRSEKCQQRPSADARFGSLPAVCWTGLSGAEELADIWRIFARFSEGMPAWSLTDEFREPGFMLYLLMEDRER